MAGIAFYPSGTNPATIKFATGGLLGTSLTRRTLNPEFDLGAVTHGSNNSTLRYVKATGAVAAGNVAVSAANVASSGSGYKASAPFAANEFGWVESA